MLDGAAPTRMAQLERPHMNNRWLVTIVNKRNAKGSGLLPLDNRLVGWILVSELPDKENAWQYLTLLPDDNAKSCGSATIRAIDGYCAEVRWHALTSFERTIYGNCKGSTPDSAEA
jgi:hypothetical protein